MIMNNISKFDAVDNVMKQISKTTEQTLKKIFDSKIKQSFLIGKLHKVKNILGTDLFKYYDLNINNEKVVTGDSETIEYEICKIIVGLHRSNCIFLNDCDRASKEKNEVYKKELEAAVIMHIKLRHYSAIYFRKKQIILGDEFIFYSVPYKIFSLCINAIILLKEKNYNESINPLYVRIFNKSLAALTLLEDNFLDNAYPICRVIIEFYIKLLIMGLNSELVKEHDKFSEYDRNETCCGKKYPEEFEKKYSNRRNKKEQSKINFLHYGWVDLIDDYHEIVTQKPYSMSGLICYLSKKQNEVNDFETIKHFYHMCHSYTHGNVSISMYPLLHYFEISIILSLIIPHTYELLCNHLEVDKLVDEIDVMTPLITDKNLLFEQYKKKTTKNFNAYYNSKK